METLEGVVVKVGPRKENGWAPFTIRYRDSSGRTVRGQMTGIAPRLLPGQTFTAQGAWQNDTYTSRKTGKKHTETQFKFQEILGGLPKTNGDAVTFLTNLFSPMEHGILKPRIQAVIKQESADILEYALDDPEVVVQLSNNPDAKRPAILRDWNRIVGQERALALMQKAGLKKPLIDRILKVFEEDTYRLITQDPYAITSLSDIDFAEADKLGTHLGIGGHDDRRIASAVEQAVSRTATRNGHTYCSAFTVVPTVAKIAGVREDEVVTFLENAVADTSRSDNLVVSVSGQSNIIIAEKEIHDAEKRIETGVIEKLEHGRRNDPDRVEAAVHNVMADAKLPFDETQMEAVRMAAREPVAAITGGPGTGKSAVQAAVAAVSEKLDGQVFLAAPTGTAAVRLNEAIADAGVNASAKTVHRLLEGYPSDVGYGHIFRRNRDNPLPGPCTVIVDEGSMLDAPAMAGLIDALPENGRILLVGDRHQLPSVGPGQIMRDLTQSGAVPTTELVKVYRQEEDSAIPHGAAMVRDGKCPDHMLRRDQLYGGIAFFACDDTDIEPSLDVLVDEHLRNMGYDPFKDVAVLTPRRRKQNSVNTINARLADTLNPRENEQSTGSDIRPGDRVMFWENDTKLDVYNGDTGILVSDTEDGLTVNLDDGRQILFPPSRRRDFDLAYATTIHKSQGQQYPVVVIPVAETHRRMLDRPLLYTGWTRAKDMLLFVGSQDVIQAAVANTQSHERLTMLGTRLKGYAARLSVQAVPHEPDTAAHGDDPKRTPQPAPTP